MIRKARIADVPDIHALIMCFAEKQQMLPKSRAEIYENLRDFYVFEQDGGIAGCGALHIVWEDLAEIKSVAVSEEFKGLGIGRQIAEKCLAEMASLGIRRTFALTYNVDFFRKLGFKKISKKKLPQKVWSECVRCPQFPDCGEEALIYELPGSSATASDKTARGAGTKASG
jgi:amino-acid N-acetyltransferase